MLRKTNPDPFIRGIRFELMYGSFHMLTIQFIATARIIASKHKSHNRIEYRSSGQEDSTKRNYPFAKTLKIKNSFKK